MIKKQVKYIIFTLIALSVSCDVGLPVVNIPDFGENSMLSSAIPLNDYVKQNIEGVYDISDGKTEFGTTFVLKSNGNYLSVFSGQNAVYMVLQGGIMDSGIVYEGYWRVATGSETGTIRLFILNNNGADSLVKGYQPEKIIITGYYIKGRAKNENSFSIKLTKPLASDKNFWIIGHRGGGRNSDRLQASENSVEMIMLAERLGANSIEIDVKLTKDKIPVLFHDENLSLRLINESYFIGSISNYTFAQLRTFCNLKYGGEIPSLEEALDTVLEKTNLKLVWLDIKSSGLIETVAKVQEKYMEKAELMGRDLEILIGLPTEEAIDEYLKFEGHEYAPAICELSLDDVRKTNAVIWAPRWSLGLQTSEIEQMHSEGRRAFVWTLDESRFIKIYMKDGIFEGILSNYPSIVAYEYYSE
ncbi:glycerophosphodiester phosphodiesterase [Bacteroidota bacterium]